MSGETIVIGAGMVGVSVAYHLARRGRDVVLVDRRPPGRETSFGNAGLIQREAVQPHPFPRDLPTLLRVLPNRSIDIRYRWNAMRDAARPLWKYWRHSAPGNYAKVVPEYASLIMRCTEEHEAMLEVSGAQSLVKKDGWLDAFRTRRELDKALQNAAEIAAAYGVEYRAVDRAGIESMEPHLSDAMVGAVHWTNAWSVLDPGALVSAYARAFEKLGGHIVKGEVCSFSPQGHGWQVATDAGTGTWTAQEVVVAMGPWSGRALAPLGYRFPLFPMRGYHMHYATAPGTGLHHWLMDYEAGYLLAPMRAGVRLTTGAEMARLDAPIRTGQLEAAEGVARQLLPLGERLDDAPWLGARPCMPDMKPVIGPAPAHQGLWLAFGHGHQGFTLGPVTGRLLGEMMDAEPPCVASEPFSAERFPAVV